MAWQNEKPVEETGRAPRRSEPARLAKEQDLSMMGPDGAAQGLTKMTLESALSEEMTKHPRLRRTRSGCRRVGQTSATGPRRKSVTDGETLVRLRSTRHPDRAWVARSTRRSSASADSGLNDAAAVVVPAPRARRPGNSGAHFAGIYALASSETVRVKMPEGQLANRPSDRAARSSRRCRPHQPTAATCGCQSRRSAVDRHHRVSARLTPGAHLTQSPLRPAALGTALATAADIPPPAVA